MVIENYLPVGWENAPSKNTPVSATNLKHMDDAILVNRQNLMNLLTLVNNLLPEEVDKLIERTNANVQAAQEAANKAEEIAGFDVTLYLKKTDAAEIYATEKALNVVKETVSTAQKDIEDINEVLGSIQNFYVDENGKLHVVYDDGKEESV